MGQDDVLKFLEGCEEPVSRKQIAESMNVDWEVLIAATFLHDIGRHYPEGIREHGPISAPFAKKVLERVNFPTEKIENVIISIKYHDESFPSEKRGQIFKIIC